MIFRRKKKIIEQLLKSFGKLKDDSFNFDFIERYFKKKDASKEFQVISDKTCNDLDFKELFKYLDRTNSKIGQQYLYHKLRTIPSKSDENIRNEKLIDLFTKNSDFRISVQKQLKRLNNYDVYFITTLFQYPHLKPPKWFFIIRILAFTSLLSLILIPLNLKLLFLLFGIFLVNTGIHFWNKRNLYQYIGSIPQLVRLLKVARLLFKYDNLKTIKPNLNISLDVTDKIKNRMSLFKMEAKLESAIESFIMGFFELFKIVFLLEPLLLFGILKQLDTKREEVENIFKFVGEIDCLISIASLRKGLPNYCNPTIINAKKSLFVGNAYHPLIFNCIENNIEINKKSILLTGSNMSGKTSFIRTIGINVITGLTINTCFANQFSMPRMRVFSAIRISDDLLNDKSYYFEEVITIKEMIDKSEDEKSNLFLLDEIFKGTNTIERISAGKAVLSFLAKGNNLVFVSTHDIELADILNDAFDFYHFSETVDKKTVDFDYKLKSGKLKTRNAIKILQINKYPEKIINESIEISNELDKIIVANNVLK
mgnify:FL=1